MAPSTKYTAETAKELLRTMAAANGGHLNSKEYERLAPDNVPSFVTLYKLFGVNGWADICRIVGIFQHYSDTLPEVLDDAQIREVICRNYKGASTFSIAHRQQVALWCLRQATEVLGEGFTKSQYEASARRLGLVGSWMVASAFGDSWNRALMAAGIPVRLATKLGEERKPRQGVAATDARQQIVIDGMIATAVPADWRTHEHGMPVCAVTQVTQVYRHVTVPEYGLRYVEERMLLR